MDLFLPLSVSSCPFHSRAQNWPFLLSNWSLVVIQASRVWPWCGTWGLRGLSWHKGNDSGYANIGTAYVYRFTLGRGVLEAG